MKILHLLIFFPVLLFGQGIYSSKEETDYKLRHRREEFKPKSIEEVKTFQPTFFKLLTTNVSYSLKASEADRKKAERDLSFLDPESWKKNPWDNNMICKYSNKRGVTAILYLDSKYDEFMWGEPGYWLRIESKTDSSQFYMGIAQNYYFKIVNTGLNIWKNDTTLQFPALRVRLIKPFVHPISAPKYETIDDNLILEINLSDLRRDSDFDGLTDIEEEKLLLNPRKKDTDNDGINDLIDHNPRFKSLKTNETLVYTGILDNYINEVIKIRSGKIINPIRPSLISQSKSKTFLIVSDDKNLQNADFEYDRYIIISSNEFKKYSLKYPITIDEITVTPLFKVDGQNSTFLISRYWDLGGEQFLVKKLNEGYDMSVYSSWIH